MWHGTCRALREFQLILRREEEDSQATLEDNPSPQRRRVFLPQRRVGRHLWLFIVTAQAWNRTILDHPGLVLAGYSSRDKPVEPYSAFMQCSRLVRVPGLEDLDEQTRVSRDTSVRQLRCSTGRLQRVGHAPCAVTISWHRIDIGSTVDGK